VWQLYHATTQFFADRAAFFEERKIERESLQRAVEAKLSPDFAEEIDAHFEFMPDNYFRASAVDDIAAHVALFRSFLQNLYQRDAAALTPAMKWEAFPEQGHSTVSLCTWDSQQLLAKIAGAFAVVPLNILSADIYTRGDNVVLDVFRVCDLNSRAVTADSDRALVSATLQEALTNPAFDFRPLLAKARSQIQRDAPAEMEFPTTIATDNRAHPDYTLISIQTPDRIGLLYDLVSALREERISIALSRISTEKGAAVDTFYVVDALTRGKITDAARLDPLQKRLQQAALETS
ncbi:MAG: hypothetical protein M3Y86_08195, partial [Verrucomicrobiota bacterium]|nr:hypothetical protein [Verrucomicrobiota bacterium]